MSAPEDWATATRAADIMHRMHRSQSTNSGDDARVMVERVTHNTLLCSGPVELFSNEMPVYHGSSTEDELAPIDLLYGRYVPEDLRIEIFVNRIRADAPRFHSEFLDLLSVVRIHEYAHAVVHAGIGAANVTEQLGKLGAQGTTDWEAFRADRNRAFSALDDESGELLAQAITWACVTQEPASPLSERLVETFLALEKRQSHRYQLPSKVKQRARLADWDVVLRTAQGDVAQVRRGPSFQLAAGLAELIRQTAEPRDVTEIPSDHPVASAFADLQLRLSAVDLAQRKSVSGQHKMELLVKRKGRVELRMYKESAHHRPHFHIEYKREFEASYAIDDFTRLAGFMPRKYESEILLFARDNQTNLIEQWRSLNGTVRIGLPAD